MIRPLTCLCFLLACASGLYLYESKHEVQVLDRQIERTVRDIDAMREQMRVLHAEWTLLNDPERLRQFSDRYLSLKSLQPAQFTSLADLDTRLPAPRPPEVPKVPSVADLQAGEPLQVGEPPATAVTEQPAEIATDDEPLPLPPMLVPPRPAQAPATVIASPPPAPHVIAERKPVVPRLPPAPPVEAAPVRPTQETRSLLARAAEPRVAEPRPIELRPTEIRRTEKRPDETRQADSRPAEPRAADPRPAETRSVDARPEPRRAPVAAPAPQSPAPPAFAGSLLGMARGNLPAPMPMPRPTPINAAQWTNGN